jgi:predicted TIM-barrel fold metal-dependent hydrolase
MAGVPLEFCDCNVAVGLPMNRADGLPDPPATGAELLPHLDRAGIRRALVWHVAQRDSSSQVGNDLLAQAIAGQERLAGCWALLPDQCGEPGDLDTFFLCARRAGGRAFRAFPEAHRFLLRREVVGDILDRLVAARLPLFLRVPGDLSWDRTYDLLRETPELTLVLTDMGCWGNDRLFRPLLDRYPNVYVETSGHIVDGGVEDFVSRYGASRLLFGSGFPSSYLGAMMLAVAQAEVTPEDRRAIAGGNLDRLLASARW